jgi:hypothetical protein
MKIPSLICSFLAVGAVNCLCEAPLAHAADPGIDASSVRVSEIAQVSATVTWNTARPSTTQAALIDLGDGQFIRRFPEPMGDVSPMATSHSVTITDLVPDKDYGFVVISSDSSGTAWRYPALGAKPKWLTFHTKPFDPSGPTTFRIDTYGSQNVYAGSDLYIGIYPVPLSGQKKALDLSSSTFTPPASSITSHLINSVPNADERKDHAINPETRKPTNPQGLSGYIYSPSYGSKVRLRTTAATPPGRYTVSLSFSSSGMTVPVTHTFNVLEAPGPVQRKPIPAAPPIPGLDRWKKRMVADGKRFGVLGEAMAFGVEQQVWYYDGGRVFLQISDYLDDKANWVPCAQNVLNQYAERASSGAQGWRVFPHGLAMYYWRYQDERMKQAVLDLASKSTYAHMGGGADVLLERETAYIINAYVKSAQLGEPVNPLLKVAVDYALGHLDMTERPGQYDMPFMDGLAAEALIGYYEYTLTQGKPDHRIPPAIKKMLDWLWDRAVNKANGKTAYQVLNVDDYKSTERLEKDYALLNNLIAPAYAWYWNLTGDDTYRQEGDFLFQHGLDDSADGLSTGKEFSQNYKGSFDYVHYRSSARPVLSLADPSSNPRDKSYKPDTTAPKITAVRTSRVTRDSATITWTTDKPGTSWVHYGTSTKYASYAPSFWADSNHGMTRNVTDHTVTVTGLKPGTAYHFVVMSMDRLGNKAVCADQEFSTDR